MFCSTALQESEDAVKALAKEKDMLEREKWDLRRQTKEATEQANLLRSHMDMKENRLKELEAELTMVGRSLTQRGHGLLFPLSHKKSSFEINTFFQIAIIMFLLLYSNCSHTKKPPSGEYPQLP